MCIGSIEELAALSGKSVEDITDLHRENIDDITIPSQQGKGDLHRIPEVGYLRPVHAKLCARAAVGRGL